MIRPRINMTYKFAQNAHSGQKELREEYLKLLHRWGAWNTGIFQNQKNLGKNEIETIAPLETQAKEELFNWILEVRKDAQIEVLKTLPVQCDRIYVAGEKPRDDEYVRLQDIEEKLNQLTKEK